MPLQSLRCAPRLSSRARRILGSLGIGFPKRLSVTLPLPLRPQNFEPERPFADSDDNHHNHFDIYDAAPGRSVKMPVRSEPPKRSAIPSKVFISMETFAK